MPRFATLFLLFAAASTAGLAQPEVSFGADLVSRYVWRGFDFGQSAAAQPYIELTSGDFTVGTWGSFGISDASSNELDLYASYAFGPITVGVTDYYFPTDAPDIGVTGGSDYFNFDDGGDGAHYIEPFVSYDGGDAIPLGITIAPMLYNDPEFSTYIEASTGFEVSGVELGLALGSLVVLDEDDVDGSALYGTSKTATVTNIMLSAGREIPITDQFSLPVFGQYIVNPETERAFLLFGISL